MMFQALGSCHERQGAPGKLESYTHKVVLIPSPKTETVMHGKDRSLTLHELQHDSFCQLRVVVLQVQALSRVEIPAYTGMVSADGLCDSAGQIVSGVAI